MSNRPTDSPISSRTRSRSRSFPFVTSLISSISKSLTPPTSPISRPQTPPISPPNSPPISPVAVSVTPVLPVSLFSSDMTSSDSHIKIPFPQNESDFPLWASQIQDTLKSQNLLDCITTDRPDDPPAFTTPIPTPAATASTTTATEIQAIEAAYVAKMSFYQCCAGRPYLPTTEDPERSLPVMGQKCLWKLSEIKNRERSKV